MSRLLVSVRDAEEASAAVLGGADVIDVKEPSRGPLGRADVSTWRAVRRYVPAGRPVSIALGELTEWIGLDPPGEDAFAGISYRKLGLAGTGRLGVDAWGRLRSAWGAGPPWVAVAYADWRKADAPDPIEVFEASLTAANCAGILIDSFDKSRPAPPFAWQDWPSRSRGTGHFVALAGGLDVERIARLALLGPDLLAVRGAACVGGDRLAAIDPDRVAALALAAKGRPDGTADRPVCPFCGGPLMEIRAKLQCVRCHTICETCCEGGRG